LEGKAPLIEKENVLSLKLLESRGLWGLGDVNGVWFGLHPREIQHNPISNWIWVGFYFIFHSP